jgi:hypothetical protein
MILEVHRFRERENPHRKIWRIAARACVHHPCRTLLSKYTKARADILALQPVTKVHTEPPRRPILDP